MRRLYVTLGIMLALSAPAWSQANLPAYQVQTPATNDNSNLAASTAYVQSQGYVTAATAPVRSVAGKTGAVALVPADIGLAVPVPVAQGGCAGTTAATCRSGIGAAASGANGDITSLTALTVPIWAGTWTAYTPTVTFTGGTGTAQGSPSGAYSLNGKTLFIRVQASPTFTTAPSLVTFSLPSGTCNGVNNGQANNVSSGSTLSAICNGTTTVSVGQLSGIATGNAISVSMAINLQ